MKVMMKYAGNKPISLLKSEYQGCEYQKEKLIHDKETSSATINFALVVKCKLPFYYCALLLIESATSLA